MRQNFETSKLQLILSGFLSIHRHGRHLGLFSSITIFQNFTSHSSFMMQDLKLKFSSSGRKTRQKTSSYFAIYFFPSVRKEVHFNLKPFFHGAGLQLIKFTSSGTKTNQASTVDKQ